MIGKKKKTIADLIDMFNFESILSEVQVILAMMSFKPAYQLIEQTFADIVRLFDGRYPGYRQCTTPYHDLKHATDTMLAMARLMHGAILEGKSLTRSQVSLGIICALMHDTGYIQKEGDTEGTGAKYTGLDTIRSIEFMKEYLTDHSLMKEQFVTYADILICTSLEKKLDDLSFSSSETELLCKLLGTADLMAQMSDRIYLEKLLNLFKEFQEAKLDGYKDELDLLKKTKDFYEIVKRRFTGELNGVFAYAQRHFKERWGIDRNLYIEAIESNMNYLNYILENHEINYRKHLRRRNTMQNVRDRKQ
jgi:hypothetical protein